MHPVDAMRSASCEVKLAPPKEQVVVSDPAAKKAQDFLAAKSMGVTVEKLHEMIDYTKRLRKKFPHMKEDRVKRKVAEYFKIKLT